MEKTQIINNEEFRMKVVNFLKIYGYYDGILVKNGMDKKYVSLELRLIQIIQSKQDYKELKMSINKVLDYCYENNFKEIEAVMKYFYQNECLEVKKKYGNFFERH